MARLLTAIELEQERLEVQQKLTGNYPLPTDKPAIVYSRYSTAKQARDSIAAGLQQSEKLIQRALDLNWTRELLTLQVENQMEADGRIRNVSGTIPIETRAGMSATIELVKAGKGAAIICDDISRLTRDADLVDAMALAKVCKQHDTVIVTSDRVYNFKRQGDFDAYIDEAQAAAAFIETHIRGKMLKNRTRKANQGKVANGLAPVGLLVVDDSLTPSPHAERVDWLYKRFRELEASLNGLLREVLAMSEPLFPVADGIDPKSMFLSRVEKDGVLLGWTVTSRFGLKHILTNPAYAGHLVFNGRVVKRDAFPAIVDAGNWQYAFQHLSNIDLDGSSIEHEQKAVRYVQQTSSDTGALLAGSRYNGTAVLDGTDGSHVYVHKLPVPTYTLTQRHTLMQEQGKLTVNGYETSISTRDLDRVFETHLLNVLMTSEGTAELATPKYLKHFTIFGGMKPVFHELAFAVDGTNPVEEKTDDTLETLNSEIASQERHIKVAGDLMTDVELRAAYERLARLRNRKRDLEASKRHEADMQAELKQAREDVKHATGLWRSWDVDRKRRLIRLVTDAITLEELADGWLRLTVRWSAVLGGTVEQCYINRTSNQRWNESDLTALHENFPTAPKAELLRLFPARCYNAIVRQARERGIKRNVSDKKEPGDTLSHNDRNIIQRFRLAVEPVQWLPDKPTNPDLLS